MSQPDPEAFRLACKAKQTALLAVLRSGYALMEAEFAGEIPEETVEAMLAAMDDLHGALERWKGLAPLVKGKG